MKQTAEKNNKGQSVHAKKDGLSAADRLALLRSFFYEKKRQTGGKYEDHIVYRDIVPPLLPSQHGGAKLGPLSVAADYKAMLQDFPFIVRPGELIIGDYQWFLKELRGRDAVMLEAVARFPDPLAAQGVWSDGPHGHTFPDFSRGLQLGFKGIAREIEESREKHSASTDPEKTRRLEYLQACQIVVKSSSNWILGYAKKCEELAAGEQTPFAAELLEIAERCRRIAWEPPHNFKDALQLLLFLVNLDCMTSWNCLGRVDQYLYPFYQRDLERGHLTREEALLWIKAHLLKESWMYFTLGGQHADGTDAVNEISYLYLQAFDELNGDPPTNFAVRYHSGTSRDFFEKAVRVLYKVGYAAPILVNDEVIINGYRHFGVPLEIARGYGYCGCGFWCVPGREYSGKDCGSICILHSMSNALREGRAKGYKTFEQYWDEYCRQVELALRSARLRLDTFDALLPDLYPEIFTSLMMHGPIQRASDVVDRGIDYRNRDLFATGLANVADSFMAMKKVVFEGDVPLATIFEALDANFQGFDWLRQKLLAAPKYGQDNPEADAMAVRVAEHYCHLLENTKDGKGYTYWPGIYSLIRHLIHGKCIPATPDGRRAYEQLAQGINPSLSSCTRGPTVILQSMSKFDYTTIMGTSCQMELQRSNFSGESGFRNFRALIEAFFKKGGAQVSFNLSSSEQLEKAMREPDAYRHLIVRVTGFCAYFTELDRELQLNVVERAKSLETCA